MRILIILSAYKFDIKFNKTINIINQKLINILKKENNIVDICLVSSHNDYNNYENIVGEINTKYYQIKNN